jgi:phage major head subunit gpT-like protein
MDLTPENIRRLRSDLHSDFRGAFDTTEVMYPRLTTTVPSNSSKNDYTWINDLPTMREWIGSRVVQNFRGAAYSLENKTWEFTIGVKREDVEDDNLGFYTTIAQDAGQSARKHPDDLFLALLKGGATTLCYDGQYFFDTDHPIDGANASSGVYANLFPGRALTDVNYGYVRQQMLNYKNVDGRSLGIRPTYLVVPPALEITARQIVAIQTNAAGAGNPYFGTAEVLMIPELAGDDGAWYLINTTRVIKPFIFQTRRPLQLVTKNQITDEVVLIENEVRIYGDARYNMGYSLPFLAAKAAA